MCYQIKTSDLALFEPNILMNLQVGSPCQNGGVCLRQPKLLMCECADGFTGSNCERRNPLLAEVGHSKIQFIQKYLCLLFKELIGSPKLGNAMFGYNGMLRSSSSRNTVETGYKVAI